MSVDSNQLPSSEIPSSAEPPQADTKIFLWGVSLLAVVTFAIVAVAAGFRFPGQRGHETPPGERRLIDFSFTERGGRTVTREELRGKFLVVNFVHTGCSISCALVNRRMAEVQQLVAGQDDVQLLSFTVDPGTDTPAVLTKFANQFGADPKRWLFLTGGKTALYHVIETSFLTRDTSSPYMEMPGGFRKADHIAVVDRYGSLRKLLPGMKSDTPQVIAKTIEELRVSSSTEVGSP